jgi:hypothetical protein
MGDEKGRIGEAIDNATESAKEWADKGAAKAKEWTDQGAEKAKDWSDEAVDESKGAAEKRGGKMTDLGEKIQEKGE